MNDFVLPDFFEITPDLVCIAGKDGFLKKANPAVVNRLGYSEAELYSRPLTAFMHPGDVEITLMNRDKLLNGEVIHNFCNRYISKSGDIVWLEWTSVYITGKEIVFAIAKDITGRKKTEMEVLDQYKKYKGLATHFKTSIEKDRKYFAYELHEELAQLVSVINMDVGWLNLYVPGLPDKVKERIEHASTVSRLLIKTIQRLAFSISPQMLHDLGLNVTMEWLCNEFSILHNISCTYESNCDESEMTKEMQIDFFRICQESLSDILNHEEAGNIAISITDTGEQVALLIQDSGNGFITSLEKQKNGFNSIYERAKSINGRVSLQHNSGGGAVISIIVEKKYNGALPLP